MRNRAIAIAIVAGFILFLGMKLGNTVSDLSGKIDRTEITAIAGK